MCQKPGHSKSLYLLLVASLLAGMVLGSNSSTVSAEIPLPLDIAGPAGSVAFGSLLAILPNGNVVVADPSYAAGALTNVGAVYLYNGMTGALISTLSGSRQDDQVGSGGITVLSNGNFVVASPKWIYTFLSRPLAQAGAVTWCSGTTGCNGTVWFGNSLVGTTPGDQVGSDGITALSNGSYIVVSTHWDNAGVVDAGAATWCSGTTGCTGRVWETNSLVGASAGDQVGATFLGGGGITVLSNGNYIVSSNNWDNGSAAVDAGAVTWCSGAAGCTGPVSAGNSLVGSTAGDEVGANWYDPYIGVVNGVSALSNGNFFVLSHNWANSGTANTGAATWCSGTAGCTGPVSVDNSLVGSTDGDHVGAYFAQLTNSNYVILSPTWINSGQTAAGAATWCSGAAGCPKGAVSAGNSLVGTKTSDSVGSNGITPLSNGSYVVSSPNWGNVGAANAGAATWCGGAAGCKGTVSAGNSLVGTTTGDMVSSDFYGPMVGITPLSNGSYVVASPDWANFTGAVTRCSATGCTGPVTPANSLVGTTAGDQVGYNSWAPSVTALSNGAYVVNDPGWGDDSGAVTWCGAIGCTGPVTPSNSLVGAGGDMVGIYGVTVLSNGNYVVASSYWANSGQDYAGAVTWCSGTAGCTGPVSAANSLVGTHYNDTVGSDNIWGVAALSNGGYVVRSQFWVNGGAIQAGAVTWCGTAGCTGPVSAANSLVGAAADDLVGARGIIVLSTGDYIVPNPNWANGGAAKAGAVTWCSGTAGCTGPVTDTNSLVGTTADDEIGTNGIYPLGNAYYFIPSPSWVNNGLATAGAITLREGNTPVGPVTSENSFVGTHEYASPQQRWLYSTANRVLVFSSPVDSKVRIYHIPFPFHVYLPLALSP